MRVPLRQTVLDHEAATSVQAYAGVEHGIGQVDEEIGGDHCH
jgi:hypothetical protein